MENLYVLIVKDADGISTIEEISIIEMENRLTDLMLERAEITLIPKE